MSFSDSNEIRIKNILNDLAEGFYLAFYLRPVRLGAYLYL